MIALFQCLVGSGRYVVSEYRIISCSSSIIIAHNHPSGDEKPSKEDIEVTQRLIKTGLVIGIELLDHVNRNL